MEQINSDIKDKVRACYETFDDTLYAAGDVQKALAKEVLSPSDFAALLSSAAQPFLEAMAARGEKETKKHFGNSVYLFTPLYISNYCENHCVYCGFNCRNQIHRVHLETEQIEKEMQTIKATGLEEILILVGESRHKSTLQYLGEACKIAAKYFKTVGLEVYPMNSQDYAYLQACGADYVTVFQETYCVERYEKLHLSGHKRSYPYRLEAQERAVMGGMRGVAFGALLGLADHQKDAFATGMHAYYLQRKYPQVEISFSCPRIRPAVGTDFQVYEEINERQLLQAILAYRIFMPYAGITVSTRENQNFRDHVVGLAATKISAGVDTGVGENSEAEKGDEQFEIADGRSVEAVYHELLQNNMQPVMNDHLQL
ncbi:2-iminoacetate synthase ThiH [Ohessyouella blattaphilus]|uniref:2-iminoacetate synthase ThiH n=1 Tax=Ohessyouella blattaphilus TaxID=2949333 RepID=UPI003EC111C2